jgi:hypothetical protein
MGLNFICRSASSNDENYFRFSNNPDPTNFKILRRFDKGFISLIEVKFPDCINYEGNKIIIIETTQLELAIKANKLDPHFSDVGQSVIARFEPTKRGWEMAKEFIEKCYI